MKYLVWGLMLIIAGAGCRDRALEKFKAINDSLGQKAAPERLPVKADSLLLAMHRAIRYVDSAHDLLQAKDTTGVSMHVADALLVHTALGDTLRLAMLDFMTRCRGYVSDPTQLDSLDRIFYNAKTILGPDYWYHENFHDVPTVAGLTILAVLRSDCVRGANFAITGKDDGIHEP
jgi:hypothetical protein